ncbi:venom toxin OcyC11 isoform X2 [Scaptodrosophila lebanonensis]|uniref:Venom toxin OcyC11 isoform X2 n=1 Tax=Drosophila lebanonensis TaxID=7225 RepID=A0A6J2U3C0_DROLE|nr:venom toxin OcyC11 isoform X2 [Scaptodrosophila lebanonensis]
MVGRLSGQDKIEFPGKCVITPSIILNSGVRIKDPNHDCRQIVCGLNGLALVQGCGVHTLSPPCYFGDYVNLDLDYPMCCERMVLCD